MTTPTLQEAQSRIADLAEATAMRDLCSAAPAEFVRRTGLRCLDVAGATLLIAPGIPSPMFNRAMGLGVFGEATEAGLDAVIAAFRDAGCRTSWVHLSPCARPAALEDWIVSRGFRLARRRAWAKMLLGPGPIAPPRTDLQIREVGSKHSKELARVLVTAYEMPETFEPLFVALVGRPGWHAVAGFDGETIACGGFLHRDRGMAWLGVGGTLPAFRGRGGQGAVMAARIRIAREHAIHDVVTETGEPVGDEPNPSLSNMRRFGFQQVCSRLNYEPG